VGEILFQPTRECNFIAAEKRWKTLRVAHSSQHVVHSEEKSLKANPDEAKWYLFLFPTSWLPPLTGVADVRR